MFEAHVCADAFGVCATQAGEGECAARSGEKFGQER